VTQEGFSVASPVKLAADVGSWNFADESALGWAAEPGVSIAPDSSLGLPVRTNSNSNYQLVSPNFTLKPGTYRLWVRAEVRSGGMNVGVLSASQSRFLAAASFWRAQTPTGPRGLPVTFVVSKRTSVQIALSNFNVRHQPSRWLIQQVTLQRVTDVSH
jgi:hypothetical protein